MSTETFAGDAGRVNEPQAVNDYAAMFSRVAEAHEPIIVCRNGQELAAVVPMEHLKLIREALAQEEAEKAARQIHWDRVPASFRPPQSWFGDEEDNPFEPEATSPA
jgi:hypothetical protein